MTVVAQWGGIWGLFTLMTQAPTYFKHIHGFEIQMTGILSGLPHICRMIFALCVSWTGDYLLQTGKISRTALRKLAGSMCTIVKGLLVLAMAYSGCNSTAAIVFLTLATAVHGAVSTGPLANIVDISPNFAGILLGISSTIAIIPGFVSPIIVGILTNNNVSLSSNGGYSQNGMLFHFLANNIPMENCLPNHRIHADHLWHLVRLV
jgi:MFS transporter, ACS family, solute carrier family 17 (sodium-dependent inorganic phosphate cotransporter), member 5